MFSLVAQHYGVSRADLQCQRRNATLIRPRQMCFFLASAWFDHTASATGRYFDRDHATVIYGRETVREKMRADRDLAELAEFLATACLVAARLRQRGFIFTTPEIDPAATARRILEGGERAASRTSILEIMAMAEALSRTSAPQQLEKEVVHV